MSFEVTNSIMVKSPENGIVDEIGKTLDGVKYIKTEKNDKIDYIDSHGGRK